MTFDGLPEGWRTATLGDIAVDAGLVGGPFGSSLGRKDYVADGVPVIRGTNIAGGGRFDEGDLVFVTEEKVADDLRRNTAVPGDIILTQRGTLGQVGLVPQGSYPTWVISQSQERLRVDQAKANRDFVFFALRSPALVDEIKRRAITTGVPHINLGITQELPIPLPPLAEQERIAGVLAVLEAKVENNRRIAKTLEEIAATLFDARFVDFVDHDDLVDSEIGRIPRDWRVRTLGDIASVGRESVDPQELPDQELEHFSFPAFDSGRAPEITTGGALKSAKLLVNERCVLVSKLNPERPRTWWPIPAGQGMPVCSPEFVVLEPEEAIPHAFLYAVARLHPGVREHVMSHATGTTGSRQRVKPAEVLSASFAMPPAELLERESHPLAELFAAAEQLLRESQTLAGIRDRLLPKLISGDIRIPSNTELTLEAS